MEDIQKGTQLDNPKEGSGITTSLKRIDFCDRRVYQRSENLFYPSVTSILGSLPVDPFFLEWVKDVGHNADLLRNRAAKEGTEVHNAIERLLAGEIIQWQNLKGEAQYNLTVWRMILKFVDFYQTHKPETLGSEMFLYSDKYRYAGTTDYLCKLNGEVWLIDFKTSNHLSKSYDLQLAAYAKALEELKGIHVDKAGVMWLKASTRKPSKTPGVYQGDGWQIKQVENLEVDFEAFLDVYKIFKLYNPKVEPYTRSYPTEVSLN